MPFNSREYEYADITAVLNGRDLVGIRAVKYSEKQEAEPLHAKGRFPHSIQTGNRTYDGELGLLQSEYEALVKAGNGSVLNLRGLTLTIGYGNPSNGDAMLTDQCMGIVFTEAGKDWSQGDKFADISLPFMFTRLNNQVQ